MNARPPVTTAGIALILAGVTFFVGEAIAAAAWPGYSYLTYFISDLGVPTHEVFNDKAIHSPRAWALNGAWMTSGALVLLAALLLRVSRPAGRLSAWLFALTIGYTVGLFLVAVFHEAPAWMFPYHLAGAVLGIGGGNVAVVLAGLVVRAQRGPRALTSFLVGAGAFGLVFLVLQSALPVDAIGLLERAAAYPVLLVQITAGVLLVTRGHLVRARDDAPTTLASPDLARS